MKKTLFISALTLGTFLFTSCGEDCENFNNPACEDVVPDELCEMLCTSWFYDSETNSCIEVSYGCCNPAGFATKAACEECDCN